MNCIDLSHPITQAMPLFPGTQAPRFSTAASVPHDGFAERRLRFSSHTGTHIDAPSHIYVDGKNLNDFPVSHFMGQALLIDCRNTAIIGLDLLKPYAERLSKANHLLLYTGWDQYWGQLVYYAGFPCLSHEAAAWLVQQDICTVGLDALSVDPTDSESLSVHHILLGAGVLIVENLQGLHQLPAGSLFGYSCLPPKFDGADGAPVRAVATLAC